MTMSLDEKQSQILGTQQSKEIMREWTLNERAVHNGFGYMCTNIYNVLYIANGRHERNETKQIDRQIKKTHTERLNEHTTKWTNERMKEGEKQNGADVLILACAVPLPLQSIDVCRVNRCFDSCTHTYEANGIRSERETF